MSRPDRAYPWDFPVYAVLAGAVSAFADRGSIATGLVATAFWLVVGWAMFRRRSGPMGPCKPDPWDPPA